VTGSGAAAKSGGPSAQSVGTSRSPSSVAAKVSVARLNVDPLDLVVVRTAPFARTSFTVTVPTMLLGFRILIVGAADALTVNALALVAEPDGVVTAIVPVVAPDGTLVTISVVVEDVTVAAVPLKVTEF
jgi:hypothetical protein